MAHILHKPVSITNAMLTFDSIEVRGSPWLIAGWGYPAGRFEHEVSCKEMAKWPVNEYNHTQWLRWHAVAMRFNQALK